MPVNRLGRTLAIGLTTLAVFFLLSSISMPVADRRLETWVIYVVSALTLVQAGAYWRGDAIRGRLQMRGYLLIQGALAFAVGMTGVLFPVAFVMYLALTAETVVLASPRWGTPMITVGAIVVFGVNAILASSLYFGATAALMLAVTAVIAHSVAALVNRRALTLVPAGVLTPPTNGNGNQAAHAAAPITTPEAWRLTSREEEVLRAVATGSRSSDIASALGITERTVKAHLASIYQKLGVDSRTAAVAALLSREKSARS